MTANGGAIETTEGSMISTKENIIVAGSKFLGKREPGRKFLVKKELGSKFLAKRELGQVPT